MPEAHNTFHRKGRQRIGAATGAYSHIVLDSIMHGDMTPLAPFSRSNILLHVVSVEVLHWFCVIIGGGVGNFVCPNNRAITQQ